MKPHRSNSHFLQGKWVVVALVNFAIAALMGLLLRSAALVELPWLNFRYMTHAHSHAAMMGWLYMAIFALVMHLFLSDKEQRKKKYRHTFVVLQLAVIGMMVSFPFQGYGAISISFSALHLFSSYTFLAFVWRNAKPEGGQSLTLLKTAIALMVFSTLGVYALGPVTVKIGRLTDAYHLCIQFFLHFQFQGWFIFAIAALFMRQLSALGVVMKEIQFKVFYLLLIISTFGMMALPAAQYLHMPGLLPFNTVGSLAQLAAVVLFLHFLRQHRALVILQGNWMRLCAWVALGSILIKSVGQAVLSWPELALVPLNIRPMVVGFIHLLMLGMITGYLILVLLQSRFFDASKRAFRSGVLMLFSGMMGTELLLFAQGVSMWSGVGAIDFYDEALFVGSSLLTAGVFSLVSAVNRHAEMAIS